MSKIDNILKNLKSLEEQILELDCTDSVMDALDDIYSETIEINNSAETIVEIITRIKDLY